MNKISFKATFEGINSYPLQSLFEKRTQNDKTHHIKLTCDPENFGNDKFELYNNNEKTAEYTTHINPKLFWLDRLMGIYRLLLEEEKQNNNN